uniref:TPX2_importin domain-containing protein n=1 Tax=Macrostomum lignano TaxID=282301 RepID=A0A1I8FHE4_9PLAT
KEEVKAVDRQRHRHHGHHREGALPSRPPPQPPRGVMLSTDAPPRQARVPTVDRRAALADFKRAALSDFKPDFKRTPGHGKQHHRQASEKQDVAPQNQVPVSPPERQQRQAVLLLGRLQPLDQRSRSASYVCKKQIR